MGINTSRNDVSDRPVTTLRGLAGVVALAAQDALLRNTNNAFNAGMDCIQSPEVQARLDNITAKITANIREMAAIAAAVASIPSVAAAVAFGLPSVFEDFSEAQPPTSPKRAPTWSELNDGETYESISLS